MSRPFTSFLTVALTTVVLACRSDDATIETRSDDALNTSASADAASARGNAMVRIVHVADGVPWAAVRLDDALLFDSVRANSVTDFREVPRTPRGAFTVRAAGSGDSTLVADGAHLLQDGSRYSVVLLSSDMATRQLRIIRDDVRPDSGMARLRIIHAAAGGPTVDVRAVNGTANLFTAVTFDGDADYVDVQPSTLSLEVRAKDRPEVLLTVPSMTLARGTATTVVIHGATALRAFVFSDALMPAASVP